MNIFKSRQGVAVLMLLLVLPLLLFLLKIAIEVSHLAHLKQNMREHCFAEALHGLRSIAAVGAADRLQTALPETAVSVVRLPDFESGNGLHSQRKLVFNLKNGKADFNCGAVAQWKNQNWQYEIVLDKY